MSAQPIHIAAAVIVSVAAAGFLTGTGSSGAPPRAPKAAAPTASAERAPSYAEERGMRRGPNARMYEGSAFTDLTGGGPGLFDPVVQSDADKQRAIADRAARRAYDGAPPTIPHAVDQSAQPDCLACHGRGARIGDRVAAKISHAPYQSCTQCHVVASDPRGMAGAPPPAENRFVGLTSPTGGDRALATAPPQIPHPTLMRSECGSCHGVGGRNGIRSTHPYRQSCTQCHAPSAALDQRPERAP
jgi:cytochrome c-type protein NapB